MPGAFDHPADSAHAAPPLRGLCLLLLLVVAVSLTGFLLDSLH